MMVDTRMNVMTPLQTALTVRLILDCHEERPLQVLIPHLNSILFVDRCYPLILYWGFL